MNCIPNQHLIILISIIVGIGCLAGYSNYLNVKSLESNKSFEINKRKFIISAIGSASLVPLLLNMLSSNLIKDTKDFDQINYFVFAGFCFIAGFFSERFINSMGEKILRDLEKTKEKVNEAISSVKENEEKIDFIVSSESDIDDSEIQSKINLSDLTSQSPFADDDITMQTDKVIKSFAGKNRFRTVQGISKELNYTPLIVESILNGFQSHGVTKKLKGKDNRELWALTQLGNVMLEKSQNPQ